MHLPSPFGYPCLSAYTWLCCPSWSAVVMKPGHPQQKLLPSAPPGCLTPAQNAKVHFSLSPAFVEASPCHAVPWHTQISHFCPFQRHHQAAGTWEHRDLLWQHIPWEWVHMLLELVGSYWCLHGCQKSCIAPCTLISSSPLRNPPGLCCPMALLERKKFAW